MLDLKAKLAAAGLVTKEEIAAQERRSKEAKAPKGAKPAKGQDQGATKAPPRRSGLDLRALEGANKGARYEAIRRAVDAQRLDSAGPIPSAAAEPFHLTTQTGALARVYVEAAAKAAISDGSAGIVGYMSNHGLAYAVVPRGLALEIGGLFPLWLRVLSGHDGAGAIEAREAAAAPAGGSAEAGESGPLGPEAEG